MINKYGWIKFLLLFCLITTLSITVNGSEKKRLTVSAASSLKDIFTELGAEYMKENKGVTVDFNFGATGTLQTQIQHGAPVDVFAGASYESLTKLVDERLIAKEGLRMMAGNTLALVVPKNINITGQTDFHYLSKPSVRKIAIGNPTYVPAGLYAVELLKKVGIMKNVQEKLLYAANVRQALAWVETGSVDAAIVYGTDAKISHSTKVLAETAPDGPIRIRYGIAILQRSKDRDSAEKFIQFIVSKREIWKKYGFLPGE